MVDSFSKGTATLTSTMTAITSMTLNVASGFMGLKMALGGLLGANAGKAAAGITAIVMAISLAADIIDKKTTSADELV
jgi:hypothetical protein